MKLLRNKCHIRLNEIVCEQFMEKGKIHERRKSKETVQSLVSSLKRRHQQAHFERRSQYYKKEFIYRITYW